MKKFFIIILSICLISGVCLDRKALAEPVMDINGDNVTGLIEAIVALRTAAGVISESAAEKENVEDIVNTMSMAFSKEEESIEAIVPMIGVLSNIDFESGQTRQTIPFKCGSINIANITTQYFTFDGSCGITGTVTVNVQPASGMLLTFDNLTTADKCVINGNANVSINIALGLVNLHVTFNDTSVCGYTLDGTYDISYNSETGVIVYVEQEIKENVTVDGKTLQILGEIAYSQAEGISGSAQINLDGEDYNVTFSGIKVDKTCGLPIAGTLVINDISIDFSNVTCTNPTASATINGVAFTLDLKSPKPSKSERVWSLSDLSSISSNKEGLAGKIIERIENMSTRCGQAKVNSLFPLDAYYQLSGNEDCFGLSGNISVSSKVFDTTINANFDHIKGKNCEINGKGVAWVRQENGGYKASLETTSFSVCGHLLSGTVFAATNDTTGKDLLVGIKGTDTFLYNSVKVLLDGDITYSQKDGANGIGYLMINDNPFMKFNFKLDKVMIDLAKLAPISGVFTLNGKAINIEEQ